jgi:hypothetical protein
MGMNGILINDYGIDIETTAYTNTTDAQSLILLMQVSNNAATTAGFSMWIVDDLNNKMAVYMPNNTALGPFEVKGDNGKHIVPPGHKVKFACSQEGCFVELTINDGMD